MFQTALLILRSLNLEISLSVHLFELLNDEAIDIQHVGSTAIQSIHAKPILDIAVGVGELNDILPYIELLKQHGII